MSQRPRLRLLGAALVATSLGMVLPARAGDDDGGTGAPAFEHSVPRSQAPDRRAKDAPAPEWQTPLPGGCPLREGKLELIA